MDSKHLSQLIKVCGTQTKYPEKAFGDLKNVTALLAYILGSNKPMPLISRDHYHKKYKI